MALYISLLNSCVVLFVSFALLHLAQGQNSSNVSASASFFPVKPSSYPTVISTNVPLITNMSGTVIPTQIVNPNITQTVHPNVTATTRPNVTATTRPNVTATTRPNTTATTSQNTTAFTNATGTPVKPTNSVHVVTTSPAHSASPTQRIPTKKPAKDKDDDSMKKRMWVAASFAILFAITTIVLAYLVYRQRKINRELEGDPSTSRLL